ncbi:LEAF RUST 10 DISEASE-RESISTANCE LOCUS RECEPTOR-LIKE PROTEIN KINASE-like 1.1 [Neltuma alba]|uniref:LEAF RUST 10 DISEASE-RESISTANCE LOCUS RECEPTOR-LIKE PROTEIN KINASE-like 1.1 n=1 Tax=Neltuma alba TaxID=207710 RepID=UPI0010A3F7B7|nr:LEAF RUST 10 DISEASE-RESISTANCE LOCUS RECEPTOR-LIKE PROTEIN KINASE-like 1.1 [Prosopis alba]
MYKCNSFLDHGLSKQFLNYTGCVKSNNETIFFETQDQDDPPLSLATYSRVQLPVNKLAFSADPFTFIAPEFIVSIQLSQDCSFGVIVLALVLLFWHHKQKQKHVRLRSASQYPNDADPDSGRVFFGVPIFSYVELQGATKNFDSSNKLGDGGFGSVYYGKFQDGREVAVKHLFNHNYKPVEQFMTEVEILTRLPHRNLVCLYGCTSRQSHELLLVYKYIPNGTLASHLRGSSTNPALLTWPIRIKIAIETTSALAYLHASSIIHPPQGTPGYIDPQYHFCFRLTNKSDVYIFGVVLIELVSSMVAVDMGRNRDEITLGSLAIDKETRPSIDEVLEILMKIENGNKEDKNAGGNGDGGESSKNKADIHARPVTSLSFDQAKLLKSATSQNDAIERWGKGEVDQAKLFSI